MRTIIAVALMLTATTPARTYTCEQVKDWVRIYGLPQVLVMAKVYGVTAEQRRQAWACLRSRR